VLRGPVLVGQRSETVRRANLSAIVRELHTRGPLTRSELVSRTGLTRTAIRALIGDLVAADVASEGRSSADGTPGRPSRSVHLNPRRAVTMALEISVDSLAAAIVGLGGTVLRSERVDRPAGHRSVEAIVRDLVDLADVVDVRGWGTRLVGVGVAVAGIVRREDGFVSMAPNLGWHDEPLGERLTAALDLPVRVWVANEADLGALAEHRRGAAIGADHVLYISGDVGVGGGMIVDGQPLIGVAGYGGEIGHLPLNPEGLPCGCGSIGCWETEVGAIALLRHAGHGSEGGRAEVDAVLREVATGQPRAVEAAERVGRWLGIGLAGLVNAFNPGLIVLGGVIGRVHPHVAAVVERELDRRALAAPRALVRIVSGALGSEAPLLGAAELAIDTVLADPTIVAGPREGLMQLATA
jgi:predicted NBD/HSP70 family sugar kinase